MSSRLRVQSIISMNLQLSIKFIIVLTSNLLKIQLELHSQAIWINRQDQQVTNLQYKVPITLECVKEVLTHLENRALTITLHLK